MSLRDLLHFMSRATCCGVVAMSSVGANQDRRELERASSLPSVEKYDQPYAHVSRFPSSQAMASILGV